MPRRQDGPDIAIPSSDEPGALIEYRSQPADPVRVGCPNCGDPSNLIYVEKAVIERPVYDVWDVGVTEPEMDAASYDDAAVLDAPTPEPRGVRCNSCSWAFTGKRPLARLTPTTKEPT